MRYLLAFILLIAIGYSCNPVKRVMKDPVKMNEIATEVIRRGYCTNDTTIINVVSDTVYVKTEENIDTLLIGEGTCDFDTVLASGTRIVYQGGYLAIREKIKVKNRIVTQTVNNYIKDVALENVLKKDLGAARDSISQFASKIEVYQETNNHLVKKVGTTKTYLVLSWVLFAVLFIGRIAYKLKSF